MTDAPQTLFPFPDDSPLGRATRDPVAALALLAEAVARDDKNMENYVIAANAAIEYTALHGFIRLPDEANAGDVHTQGVEGAARELMEVLRTNGMGVGLLRHEPHAEKYRRLEMALDAAHETPRDDQIARLENEVSRRDAVLDWIEANAPRTFELCPYKLVRRAS